MKRRLMTAEEAAELGLDLEIEGPIWMPEPESARDRYLVFADHRGNGNPTPLEKDKG